MAKQKFMDVPGSDPNATMKGDHPQQITHSTAPGSKPKPPKPLRRRRGQFSLRKERP